MAMSKASTNSNRCETAHENCGSQLRRVARRRNLEIDCCQCMLKSSQYREPLQPSTATTTNNALHVSACIMTQSKLLQFFSILSFI